MSVVLLLAAQVLNPQPRDLNLRPPHSEDVQAAERHSRKQLPVIVQLCRRAVSSGDLDKYVQAFADRNGLASYGRVTLATQCRIYEQGFIDHRHG